jgi:hypothetical protein
MSQKFGFGESLHKNIKADANALNNKKNFKINARYFVLSFSCFKSGPGDVDVVLLDRVHHFHGQVKDGVLMMII